MSDANIQVNVQNVNAKVVKKLRKAVEKILETERASDNNISYSVDTNLSVGRVYRLGARRGYQPMLPSED